MRQNPFSDALEFLTSGRWTTGVLWVLLVSSIAIAVIQYRRDTRQRTAAHLWSWLSRLFIGAMWWQQSLWKLPPTYTDQPDGSGGLRYWMEQMVQSASFSWQGNFVEKVVLPHFSFFAPQVYAGEVLVALSLILGLFTRLGGLLGALMALNLWLGLYRAEAEWPWTYFFLFIIQVTFFVYRPGRSLGLDTYLHRLEPVGRTGRRRILDLLS